MAVLLLWIVEILVKLLVLCVPFTQVSFYNDDNFLSPSPPLSAKSRLRHLFLPLVLLAVSYAKVNLPCNARCRKEALDRWF
jgi:hypothetical protein